MEPAAEQHARVLLSPDLLGASIFESLGWRSRCAASMVCRAWHAGILESSRQRTVRLTSLLGIACGSCDADEQLFSLIGTCGGCDEEVVAMRATEAVRMSESVSSSCQPTAPTKAEEEAAAAEAGAAASSTDRPVAAGGGSGAGAGSGAAPPVGVGPLSCNCSRSVSSSASFFLRSAFCLSTIT